MNVPVVSVVIPVYNCRRYVCEAITSALDQRGVDLEVVVVDDESTDGTDVEVRERFSQEPRVRYIRQQHSERAVARNRAVAEAVGEWVAFLDADDLWLPGKISRQLALAKTTQADLIHGGVMIMDEHGHLEKPFVGKCDPGVTEGAIGDAVLRSNRMLCCTVMARRERVLAVGGFSTDRRLLASCEDWLLWTKLCWEGTAAYVDEPIACYRVHSRNTYQQASAETYRIMVEELLSWVPESGRRRVRRVASLWFKDRIDEGRAKGFPTSKYWVSAVRVVGLRFLMNLKSTVP
jgi:glycosyltransferase involved in cell wall biosynthesis